MTKTNRCKQYLIALNSRPIYAIRLVACDNFTTRLRHELLRLNQTYKAMILKHVLNAATIVGEIDTNDIFCDKFSLSNGRR